MNITTYKVAGHQFQISVPEEHSLNGKLTQYEPFVCQQTEELIFNLIIGNVDIPQQKETVWSNLDATDGQTLMALFQCDNCKVVEMYAKPQDAPFAQLLYTDDFKTTRLQLNTTEKELNKSLWGLNNAMMLIFALATATQNTLMLHASVVMNSNQAFLFHAKSGTGKSTHSQLWIKHIPGTELLNDDNPAVRIWDDGRIIAYGTPWSGKTPCYRNIEVPVGAFVRINRALQNSIERLDVVRAYASLTTSCSGMRWERKLADGLNRSLELVIANIPIYILNCLPNEEAAHVCANEVLK